MKPFYLLNRSFDTTIHAVEQLQRLEFFENAELPVLMNRLECLRSETNEVLFENMQDYEHDEAFRFGQLVGQWEKSVRNPNELYLQANENRAEIEAKISELQAALDLQSPKPLKQKPSKLRTSKRRPVKRRTAKSQSLKRQSEETEE